LAPRLRGERGKMSKLRKNQHEWDFIGNEIVAGRETTSWMYCPLCKKYWDGRGEKITPKQFREILKTHFIEFYATEERMTEKDMYTG
jgi:hypothetical protein